MAMKLYEENDIQNIANELRRYNETDDKYRVEDMTIGVKDVVKNIEEDLGTTRTVEGTDSLFYEDTKDYRLIEAEYQGNTKQGLPSEYQEVEYIESDGKQYINTNIIPSSATKATLKYLLYCNNNFDSAFGAKDSTSNFFINRGESNSTVVFNWYGNGYDRIGNFSQTTYNISTYDVPNKIISNFNGDTETEDKKSVTFSSFPTIPMYLFARNNSGSPSYALDGMKLWYCQIYNGNTLIRDYIPCYRKSDNVVGLYDLANDVFYTNSGTGTFTKGNDVSIPNPDYPQEIKTLKPLNLLRMNDAMWKKGSIASGVYANHPNRVATDGVIELRPSTDYVLTIPDGYRVGVHQLDAEQKFISDGGWKTKEWNFTTSSNTKYIKVVVSKFDGSTEAQLPIDDFRHLELMLTDRCIGVKRTGKNLLGLEEKTYDFSSTTFVDVGNCLSIRCNYGGINREIELHKNSIKVTSKTTYDNSMHFKFFNLKPNTNYSLNCKIKTNKTSGTTWVFGTNLSYEATSRQNSFTSDANGEKVYAPMFYGLGGTENYIELYDIQLEESNTPTPYEPYQERIDYIDLQENEVLSTDKLVIKDGRVKLIKNWGEINADNIPIFTFREDTRDEDTGEKNVEIEFAIDSKEGNLTVPCNIVLSKLGYGAREKIVVSNKKVYFQIHSRRIESRTKESMIKFLKDNNFKFYYPLATPQEIDLGQVDIKTLDGTNNVEILATLEPTYMMEEYMLNTQSKYLPKVTTEETSIDYVAQFPLNMIIEGNVEQEITSGKNLLPIELRSNGDRGIKGAYNKDTGEITITGTATSTYSNVGSEIPISLPAGSYVLSTPESHSNYRIGLRLNFTEGYANYTINENTTRTAITTTLATTTCYVYVSSLVADTTYNETFKVMLSVDDVPYEPYTNGASPNPDYPQEVKTLKGWNLLPFEFQGGYLNSSGAIYSNYTKGISTKDYIEIKPNTAYTLSIDVTDDSLINKIWIAEYNENKTFIKRTTMAKTQFFTSDANAKYLMACIYTVDKTISADNIKVWQLVLNTDKPYLPYNNIGVKRVGKNLFDNDNSQYKNYKYSSGFPYGLNNNITTTLLDNGFSANITSNEYLVAITNPYELLPNTTYAISFTRTNTLTTYTPQFFIWNYDGTNYTINQREQTNISNLTFTTDSNGVVVFGWGANNTANGESFSVTNIQLEKGSTATDFEPYQTRTDYIDLRGNEVLSTDKLVIKDGRVKLIKNWGKVVLDGSENYWTLTTRPDKYSFWFRNQSIDALTQKHFKYCNKFTYSELGYTTATTPLLCENDVSGTASNYMFIFNTNGSQGRTVEEWKNWLKEQYDNGEPLIVWYLLKTPQEIDLGKQDKLIPLEGTNNIEVLAELEPSKMETTYYIDAKKYIEDTTSALLELGGEN